MASTSQHEVGIPAQLTSFVGRERELSELTRMLARSRLVTLTGPGGVGKTRLALAVAEQLGETFVDGAVFVDLAPLTDASSVLPSVARSFGIRDVGDLPLVDRLATALHDREVLLILDNFEHLLDAGPLLLQVVQAAPKSTVLVTSRSPLRVRGEQEFPVAPLPCPEPTANEPVDALRRYPALELFVQRAQDIHPDFQLADANALLVAEICRRLDGLPLALELAAARIRVLPPEAMISRLGSGLSLLVGGPRDLPARQQTIRATIAWSYDLLNPAEREIFRRLSVFAGDFSLEAAAAVGGVISTDATLDLLDSLVEKNLLRQVRGLSNSPRFRMLETVREFGREELAAAAEAETINRAHAAFFVAVVEEAAPHLWAPDREGWMQRIDLEMDNLRSVAAWSGPSTDGSDSLVRIVYSLGFLYWRIRGHLHDGVRWCELALTASEGAVSPATRVTLLWIAAGLAGYMGRHAPALAWVEESVRLGRASAAADLGYALVVQGFVESHIERPEAATHLDEGIALIRATGNLHALAFVLDVAILPYAFAGEPATARATLAEALSITRQLGDDWLLAVALNSAAFLHVRAREWPAARETMEEALSIFTRFGDDGSISIIYNNLGVAAREQGDDERAAEFFQKSAALTSRVGLNNSITLSHLGDWALRHNQISNARKYLVDALRAASRSGEVRVIAISLCRLARLANALGQPDVAARLIGPANRWQTEAGSRMTPELRRELDEAARTTRAILGDERFRALANEGSTPDLAQVTAEALTWAESSIITGQADEPRLELRGAAGNLSARENEVLRLIALGRSNRQIANALTISLNTVARHISNIFDKLGVANRTEAAAYAHRQNLSS